MAETNMSAMALACIGQKKETPEVAALGLSELKSVYAAIAEEQQNTGGTILYRVKIPSGGGKAFDILTGDEETDTSVPAFSGVIVCHHKCSAYFSEEPGNSPPLCASSDGEQGVDSSTGEVRRCRDCPRTAYGTGKNGRGKACKNMHRLYIMAPGVAIPFVLCLPPTSLKNVQNYLLSTLAARQLKPWQVMTEFSVTSAQNADGVKYSVVKMKLLGRLSEADQAAADFFHEGFQAMTEVREVNGDDYNREPAVSIDAEPAVGYQIQPLKGETT